jgi:hypothetical protein
VRQIRRSRGIACAAAAIAIGAIGIAGSAAQDRSSGDAKETRAFGLPANYRQLVAQYVRARNPYVIRDAKITKPSENFGGLLRLVRSVSAVCVVVFRDNPFGIVVHDNWVMTVENGKVEEIPIGLGSCSDLSPFPELMRR